MDNPTLIGKCLGCDRMRRLEDLTVQDTTVKLGGACVECMAPPRGRKWVLMSHKCRTDPKFALAVYNEIKKSKGQKLFILMYGLPEGAKPPGDSDEPATDEPPPARRPALSLVR